jgi:DNA-binding NarL/FixJ family response regulator
MYPCLQFVVIDFHAESRFLLVKTLRRKFPTAVIHETDDAKQAIEIVRRAEIAAIITHRTFEIVGLELVRWLRNEDPMVPIIMVSGMDRAAEAVEAGATTFLPYDEWLRIGSVVEMHVDAGEGKPAAVIPAPDVAGA